MEQVIKKTKLVPRDNEPESARNELIRRASLEAIEHMTPYIMVETVHPTKRVRYMYKTPDGVTHDTDGSSHLIFETTFYRPKQ